MTDREKVIKGLTDIYDEAYDRWVHCQYIQDKLLMLIDKTMPDALALLKEQNDCENCAIAIEDRQPVVRCKDCKYGVLMNNETTYMCESPEQESRMCVHEHDGDWFCADGESRDENG